MDPLILSVLAKQLIKGQNTSYIWKLWGFFILDIVPSTDTHIKGVFPVFKTIYWASCVATGLKITTDSKAPMLKTATTQLTEPTEIELVPA